MGKFFMQIILWNVLFIAVIIIGLILEICDAYYIITVTVIFGLLSCWVEVINDD